MEPNEPPSDPFDGFDGEAHFRRWLLEPKVLQLNPWAMAAPGSFLKGAWCRHMQEERRSLLVVVMVTCSAAAAIAAKDPGLPSLPSLPSFFPPSASLDQEDS
jgi:hypothetical protein